MTTQTAFSSSNFFTRFYGEFFGGCFFLFMVSIIGITLAFPSISNAQTSNDICVRAGCSGQLCISAQSAQAGGGITTTCIFKEEYVCYQQAECVELSSGNCGWLPTAELTQCIQTALGEDDDFTIDPVTGLCKTSDLNGDGKTDIRDYSVLVSQFMTTGPHSTLSSDLNCDDKVDLIDYSLFIRNIEL